MTNSSPSPFVSRAGLKLAHALEAFAFSVKDLICCDFGCNVGGFTDCLLQNGASRVHAIDTGYGTLAWKLRSDDRVCVHERTNALHAEPVESADLVTIDLAWTRQKLALPAAARWLKPDGRVITLVKPHYELEQQEKETLLVEGRLDPAQAQRILERVLDTMPGLGFSPIDHTQSPITGGKSGRRARSKGLAKGNIEFLVLARPNA